jgi:hypothetical protein
VGFRLHKSTQREEAGFQHRASSLPRQQRGAETRKLPQFLSPNKSQSPEVHRLITPDRGTSYSVESLGPTDSKPFLSSSCDYATVSNPDLRNESRPNTYFANSYKNTPPANKTAFFPTTEVFRPYRGAGRVDLIGTLAPASSAPSANCRRNFTFAKNIPAPLK